MHFLYNIAIIIGSLSSLLAGKTLEKPNIIFIMADDLGYQDVGFNGSEWFETPHLDSMAKQAAVFKNASMYPTCSPSRTALMTGRHSFRTQVYAVPVGEKGSAKDNIFSRWTVEEKHPFYAKPLNEAGYKLIHLGKWHVVGPYPDKEKNYPFKRALSQPKSGNMQWVTKHKEKFSQYYPEGKGFHENVGGTFWGDPARGQKTGYKPPGGYLAPFKNPYMKEPEPGKWLTDHLTDEAIRFIDANKDEPFFVNLHYYSPHRPSIPHSQEELRKYQEKPKDSTTGHHAGATKEIAAYATMVENIDHNIGRLLQFLEKENLRQNTVIIFTSDNGFNSLQSMTNQLRGHKGVIYEGGIRVPSLISWPGQIAPIEIKDNITVLDYFPTILDIANIDHYSEVLDGESILPLAQGKPMPERPLFWHVASHWKQPPVSMMKKGKWKLIQFLLTGDIELYDLSKDPKEEHNLSISNKEQSNLMLQEMTNWRKANKVPLPANSPLAE